MSRKFDTLKTRWALGWVSEETLRGWVELEKLRPGAGITEEEYRLLTGRAFGEAG